MSAIDDRIKKVDLDKLSEKRVDELGVQIGNKLKEVLEETQKKANEIANVYGLKVNIHYKIEPLEEN